MTRLPVIVAALVACVPLLVGASARGKSSFVELSGVNVISVTASGSVVVLLPDEVDAKSISVSMKGKGRVLGFLLQQIKEAPPPERARLFGFTANRCLREGCRAHPLGRVERGLSYTSEFLPAGKYRLDLLADGSKATYRIEIPGMTGSSRLSASESSSSKIQTFVPSLYNSPDESVFAAGSFNEDAEFAQGVGYMAMWVKVDEAPVAWDVCLKGSYDPAPTPPPEVAFYPGCGGSDRSFSPADGDGGLYTRTVTDLSYPAGLGGWFISKTPPELRGGVAAWIPYSSS